MSHRRRGPPAGGPPIPSRRTVLRGAAALGASALISGFRSRRACAAAPGDRRFLFFFASGGWDVAQVFDPTFGAGVDHPPGTAEARRGELRWVAGADRPWVSRFFERWGHRAAIVNGLDTHATGHGEGDRSVLTGSARSALPDWPTLLASEAGSCSMPHVVFGGPCFPGAHGSLVVRGGGGLLVAPGPLVEPAPAHPGAGLGDSGRPLLEQSLTAVDLMRRGLTRSAMVRIPGSWDTHEGNAAQGRQMEGFFAALDQLMGRLEATPGSGAPCLADEVVLVALSGLGRTPRLNGAGGKDHWPYTSALVVGAGVRGGRSIGATDGGLRGLPIDLGTGRPSGRGHVLGCESLGAALLALGGVDPQRHLPGVPVLRALLA